MPVTCLFLSCFRMSDPFTTFWYVVVHLYPAHFCDRGNMNYYSFKQGPQTNTNKRWSLGFSNLAYGWLISICREMHVFPTTKVKK